ncbi:vomeronasal type-2 receptor 26-like [Bombina bombina]|uniref:vomeronasal type-2 receptor 26-like n=1 Tax=Bombina bombina TaxID=8345 RepID=UPI00235A907E|nr:vomeronasal type-2 receptor 26-like [Bombina bombina]
MAMGAKFAPSYANIYLGYFELFKIFGDLNDYKKNIRFYTRFINDVLIIWNGSIEQMEKFVTSLNNNSMNLKFTWSWARDGINFLDLKVKADMSNKIVSMETFRKELAGNTILRAESNHPKHLKSAIPKGQFMRLRRNCSSVEDYNRHADQLRKCLIDREAKEPKTPVAKHFATHRQGAIYDRAMQDQILTLFQFQVIDRVPKRISGGDRLAKLNRKEAFWIHKLETGFPKGLVAYYTSITMIFVGASPLKAENEDSSREEATTAMSPERSDEEINKYLRKAHFTTASHEDISFTDYGDVPGCYDIINWIQSDIPGRLHPNKVGSFNSLVPVGKQLNVNDSVIIWSPKLKTMPTSVCNEICAHGYRKVPWKEYPACCYGCVPCAEGEISNTTDAETCIKCLKDQWPNDKRTMCIRKTVEFLSFEDTLGIALTSVSIFSCSVTIAVLVIFFMHHTTPLVKANNQNLSYTLLLSLMLSFLCSLLFIGRPVQVTCLLRQAAFGIIFTVSVSSVLAKSVTVVIAFNATKPKSKIKKWVGSRVSIRLVLVCSLGQTMICTLWLAFYPPYPDYDTQSYIKKMILQCNEGSVTAFYLVIGYIGFLSVVSFFVAFLVRNLPSSFNEAQMITFSMLVFCSVWISFIPTHLSTKGKYMVAVEIFAMLASSAGLLGCIFIPKCYIILFKPEFNTRVHVLSKH